MQDLQNRCEKVIELEMELDQTKENYSSLMKSIDGEIYQKKMASLERNLEKLTTVQKQVCPHKNYVCPNFSKGASCCGYSTCSI